MFWGASVAILIGPLLLLMFFGVPVAVAFLLIDLFGAYAYLGGERGFIAAIRSAMASLANINLAAIPLFLLMGEILFQTGLAIRAIDAIDKLITRVPGRLSLVAISGGTIFSALSGSTVASTAMLAKALVPEMLRRGYKPEMAIGPIIGIGGLDMLIPPSALAVLLATLASSMSADNLSVVDLLVAGIIPGLTMSVVFSIYIVLVCHYRPHYAPRDDEASSPFIARAKPFLLYVLPLFTLFVVVMGSMIAGLASPTDSAALGCIAAIILALLYGKLTFRALANSFMQTALVTTMIFLILAGSTTFSQLLAYSGAVDVVLSVMKGMELSKIGAVLMMIAILILLGCLLDQISMMLVTFPFFMPLANHMEMDLVWLGVIILISLQIGLMTPPFGMLNFVVRGVVPPEITMRQIWKSSAPYSVMILFVLAAVVAFPEIATYLPNALKP